MCGCTYFLYAFFGEVIMQKINDYMQSLLSFTVTESDRMPHYYMLAGFLDAQLYTDTITVQQKEHYLQQLDGQISKKLQGEQP